MVGKSALNALFLKDDGENGRNQGKCRWEYPLEMKAGLMAELDQGFPPAGLNTPRKQEKQIRFLEVEPRYVQQTKACLLLVCPQRMELDAVLSRPFPLLVGGKSSSRDHTEGYWYNLGLKRRKKGKRNETALLLAVPPFHVGSCHFPG